MSDVQSGDKVVTPEGYKGTVFSIMRDYAWVDLEVCCKPGTYHMTDLKLQEPSLCVGERVYCRTWQMSGEILCICNQYAWVKSDGGRPVSMPLAELERGEE